MVVEPPPPPDVGVTLFDGVEAGLLPTQLLAVTVKLYVVPFVNPVNVNGLVVPVAVMPPGAEVTVYDVIAQPPSDEGAVQLTVACPLPAAALTPVGALGRPGTVAGR